MIDVKNQAELILSDLMNNKPISEVLLKVKILASAKSDNELSDWVTNELHGYNGIPPKYRILPSGLKVELFVPFSGTTLIDFPTEMIEVDKVRDRLSKICFVNPVEEIDKLCNSPDSNFITFHVTAYVYNYLSKFVNGDIQDVYQFVTNAAVSQILVSVKSVLIDFLLNLCDKENLNFSSFMQNSPIMNNVTINAGVVNTGNGTVNAQDFSTIIGNNNTVSVNDKNELLKILDEIDKLADTLKTNIEFKDLSKDIRSELQKENPVRKYIKRCFQAIPSLLKTVGTEVIASRLSLLINSALSILN